MSKPGPDPRAAVRVAAFERTLEQFNEEQAGKVAAVLVEYDKQYVAPMRERLEWLEARMAALEAESEPWWVRIWRRK